MFSLDIVSYDYDCKDNKYCGFVQENDGENFMVCYVVRKGAKKTVAVFDRKLLQFPSENCYSFAASIRLVL